MDLWTALQMFPREVTELEMPLLHWQRVVHDKDEEMEATERPGNSLRVSAA